MSIDLHMHSNFSDGALPPEDLVAICARNGVKLMSLTDHDTMAGAKSCRAAAEAAGIAFIPGIEISSQFAGTGIHVVGLGIDPESDGLTKFLSGTAGKRLKRGEEMDRKLAACGIHGALEGALGFADHATSLSRTHFALWLLESGHVKTYQEAFDKYLKPGRPAYARVEWPTVAESVRFIVSEGGTAVLAHPGRYEFSADWMRDALLDDFQKAGGLAIEVTSGSQSRVSDIVFAEKARERGFLASTGSDWHSERSPRPSPGMQPTIPKDLTPVWTRFGFPADFC
ncbi:PHP domain-containing protein [Sutterella sp.]|uniref:PHP domain-containing protein n=1 Tax=Sutterella sp. TaxID=1981025 RepID=UPI0026E09380|nr:PHP domain-containing protein [Sutterella sp.]MDO5531343.1 PHP domain-containing protein [Sutterella sp.]